MAQARIGDHVFWFSLKYEHGNEETPAGFYYTSKQLPDITKLDKTFFHCGSYPLPFMFDSRKHLLETENAVLPAVGNNLKCSFYTTSEELGIILVGRIVEMMCEKKRQNIRKLASQLKNMKRPTIPLAQSEKQAS